MSERLSVDVACHVARQLASAVEAVHDAGIVHGDLKPQNVICGDDDDWTVKLLDFGTARLTAAGREAEDTITGTPEYIAPERVMGEPPCPSNDIYSLGVVLYELLAGTSPFSGEVAQVLEQQMSGTLEPVGARRGEVLDDRLVAIVERALAKEPGERFASMAEFARELGSYLEEIGVRQQEHQRRMQPAREDAAAAAFDALAVSAAGIAANGTIVVANEAIARVLQEPGPRELEGRNVMSTTLASLLPTLREDLRVVAMRGKRVRRRVTVERQGGSPTVLRLALSPAQGACGSCVLVLYALPRAEQVAE